MKQIRKIVIFIILAVALILPVSADESMTYIMDHAGILTQDQQESLNEQAQRISDTHQCGVYFITVESFTDYGYSAVWELTPKLYHQLKLGYGEQREGILLVLSMRERKYATYFYGTQTGQLFSDHVQILLEEEFLDDFGRDKWYRGVMDYLSTAADFMIGSSPAKSAQKIDGGGVFIMVIPWLFFLVSAVTHSRLKQLDNTQIASDANLYVVPDGFLLLHQSEILVRSVYHSNSDSDFGSSSGSSSFSYSSDGGSGRSGSF